MTSISIVRSILLPAQAFIFCIGLVACSTSEIRVDKSRPAPAFQPALERHLSAIEARDLDIFRSTLTQTDELNVIFPGGTRMENTQAVLDFHKEWFSDEKWIFDAQIVKVIEGAGQSTALVKYGYQDDASSEPRYAWLLLTFQLENGEWRLIHDQNTRIAE